MNQTPGHLTDAQIKACVGSSMDPEEQPQIDAHIADCESCLMRLLEAERIHLGLLEGRVMKRTPHPDCPAEETLQELAAGIHDPDTAETTIEHAAHCDYCGPLLTRYMKEFSEDLAAEDAAVLAQLKTSTPKWQKQFVRKNFPPPPSPLRFWKVITAGATAALAIAGYFVLPPLNDLHQAQVLVGITFAKHRTIEMRLPSVPYGPLEHQGVERGNSGVDSPKPGSWYKAQEILSNKRERGELNPQWLEVEGQLSLLEATPDSSEQATHDFQKALDGDRDNASLKIDLAASYFEENVRADHPNLMRSIDMLLEVLKRPNLKVEDRNAALFDLAIAYEKSELWPQAVETWQQYLAVDHNSPWSQEARNHLEEAKGKPRQQGFNAPSIFLQSSLTSAVQANIEPYQEAAMSSWLPQAVADPSTDAAKAVRRLAELLEQQHSDLWLRDFLNSVQPGDLGAVQSLSAAFAANTKALTQQALQESNRAAKWFGQHGNVAGELRARFEEVYALQRRHYGPDCLSHAEELSNRLLLTQYHWLQTQVELEKAICANWQSDFKTTADGVALSRTLVAKYRFPELTLRVIGLDASFKRQQKKDDEAWTECVEGMHAYWQGLYSPERLYNFYAVMYLSAIDSHHSYAARALIQQALDIREHDAPENFTLKAILYLRLANEMRHVDAPALADEMSEKALALLKQIPADEQSANTALEPGIEMAELLLDDGHAELALPEISSVRRLLQMQDDFVSLDFYRVLGDAQRQLQQLDDAVESYVNAIEIAERSLRQMRDDASRVLWITATDKTYRGLTQTLLAQKRDKKALIVWERFKEISLETSQNQNFSISSGIRQEMSLASLPPVSEPHLVYASFEKSLQIWTVNGAVITSQSLPKRRAELEKQVRDFVENCANRYSPMEKWQQQAEALYKVLVQPVAGELPSTQSLAIELDQPLAEFMEVLRMPDGQYFGDGYSINYSPGILVENGLRSPLPLRPSDFFLLVDASPLNGSESLPGHEIEQDSVTRTFPQRKLMTAADVTRARLKQALRESVGFDFIGHAKPDATGMALMLNPSTFLQSADITPDSMPKLRFAVLSACASGSAKNDLLDAGSLLRSFFAAGVPTVIASHWNVDSESTSQFMRVFYDRLAHGDAVAAALQSARKELRSTRNHPYYWAAFSLNGRVS